MCGAHQAAPEGVSRVVDMIGEIEPCNLQLKAQAPLRRLFIILIFILFYTLFYDLFHVLFYILSNVLFYVLSNFLSNILAKSNPNIMLFHFYDILSYHITTHYIASIYLKLANITSH